MNDIHSSRFGKKSRLASIFLSAALVSSAFSGLGSLTFSSPVNAASQNDYGLADNIQDGTILHCFDWTYKDIIAELPNIAQAGFTSVQTSPAQVGGGEGAWWWLYQPLGFYAGSNALGTKAELQELCEQAESYGIKIIVDVVANHLAGDHSNIQSDLKPSQYWHTYGSVSNWSNRYQVTNGELGMPDLNTENSYVQQVVAKYIQELKSIGVDGIRWDAAKHIGLPSEGSGFWPAVIDPDMYNYGEILGAPDDRSTGNEDLMVEYTNYMSVTDSGYGYTLREAFNSGSVPTSYANWAVKGISNNKLVYWGESHDTWSNNKDWGYSNEMSQNVIDRAYAVAASRNQITALYFSRPSSTVKNDIQAGQKGSTHFTSAEVAAVNHFHNAMIGQKDYYTTQNNVAAVCRENGAVIVLGSGSNKDVSVKNGGSTTAPGTYIDEITGNTFTVTSSTISGHVGSSGIAVLYNEEDFLKTVSVSASPLSKTFTTDTLDVTLSVKNADSGSYVTSEGASGTFTNGQTITIGADTDVAGTSKQITVTLSAVGEDGTEKTADFTYTKKDPSLTTMLYFDNESYGWKNVYAYIYQESENGESQESEESSVTVDSEIRFTDSLWWNTVYAYFFNSNGTCGAAWPGTKMTYYETNFQGNKNYTIAIPDGATHVVFNNGNGTQTKDLTLSGVTGYYLSGSASNAKPWSNSELADTEEEILENAKWPGVAMELNTETGLYETEVPEKVLNGYVIFSDGVTSTTNRYPAKGEKGLAVNGTSMILGEKYQWEEYNPVVLQDLVNTSSISSSEIAYQEEVTITASAEGGSGEYTYSVFFRPVNDPNWTEWEVLQRNRPNNTITIMPPTSGAYEFSVTVQDSNGSEDTKYFTVNVTPVPLTNTSTISDTQVAYGDTIIANGYAKGGFGNYQYAFYYKKTTDKKWVEKQGYSYLSSVEIKPGMVADYQVCIKVKDQKNTVVKKYLDFTVTSSLTNQSALSSDSVKLGENVTVNASAAGGSGSYSYAVYYKTSTSSKWIEKQAYHTNAAVSLMPDAAGTYDVCVKVKDSSGVIQKKYLTFNVVPAEELANLSEISSDNISAGDALTLVGQASGGSGSYKYAFYYKKTTDKKWVEQQSFKANHQVAVPLSDVQTYDICIKVKDSLGTIVKKYFTVTVSSPLTEELVGIQ